MKYSELLSQTTLLTRQSKLAKTLHIYFSKDALLAYGLTITVMKNIYVDMGKDLSPKYVQTRR